jgi:hypothetical protein
MNYDLPELIQDHSGIRLIAIPDVSGLVGSVSFLNSDIPRQSSVAAISGIVAQPERGILRRDALEAEFRALAEQWRKETFFYSSLTKQFAHPAYVRIIAMGMPAIPLVLREMQRTQDNWFYALRFMAGEDAAAGMEDFEDAKSAWLEWGYRNNYI